MQFVVAATEPGGGLRAFEAPHRPVTAGLPAAAPPEPSPAPPTQRDYHLQHIAENGRRAWQKASGYTTRARAEAALNRWKQVIGDGLRLRTDDRRATEVDIAVHALNRMSELVRPSYVRTA